MAGAGGGNGGELKQSIFGFWSHEAGVGRPTTLSNVGKETLIYCFQQKSRGGGTTDGLEPQELPLKGPWEPSRFRVSSPWMGDHQEIFGWAATLGMLQKGPEEGDAWRDSW